MNIIEKFNNLTEEQLSLLESMMLLEEAERFKTDDYPITMSKIKELGKGSEQSEGGLSDKEISTAYNVFKKEYLAKKVKDALGEDFDKTANDLGLDEEGIKSDSKFSDVLSKLEEKYGDSDESSDDDSDEVGNSQEDYDIENNVESEENPVSEGEEDVSDADEPWMQDVINKVQNNKSITEPEPTSFYPDVEEPKEDTSDESIVPPVIPHFDKISARDDNGEITTGQDRADDQWITSKMLLLKKRGIL